MGGGVGGELAVLDRVAGDAPVVRHDDDNVRAQRATAVSTSMAAAPKA